MIHVLAGLLWLVPLALVFAALAAGQYPGERALLRRRVAPAVRAPRALGSRGRRPHAVVAFGTAVLAFKRAVRPPPVASLG
jgi:hypothetical protein